MMVEGEDIYIVGKRYYLIFIMFEKEDYEDILDYKMKFVEFEGLDGIFKYYFIVLVKKIDQFIESFQDMEG